jgi:1-acyl-sn-glycerol-3-phosphate acyltransferase
MTEAHSWLPQSPCGPRCTGEPLAGGMVDTVRVLWRTTLAIMLFPAIPILAMPLPGRSHVQRAYCRMMLRCLGVRITLSGGPIRNLRGVLVVSGHISWLDIFLVGAVMPGSFVARADLVDWPAVGVFARVLKVIPIERSNLRGLPEVVQAVAARLRAGQTVVAFPEGTTWCGQAYGPFRPAMFQAAIDAGRPVQPLRLSYHDRDGRLSTAPAFVGDESFGRSFRRVVATRRTVAHVHAEELQSPASGRCPQPGEHRRDLARRCQAAVRGSLDLRGEHALAA